MATTSFHINATVPYVIEAIRDQQRKGRPQDFVTRDGIMIAHDDAIAILDDMRTCGMEFVPVCDNADAVGRCQGH